MERGKKSPPREAVKRRDRSRIEEDIAGLEGRLPCMRPGVYARGRAYGNGSVRERKQFVVVLCHGIVVMVLSSSSSWGGRRRKETRVPGRRRRRYSELAVRRRGGGGAEAWLCIMTCNTLAS
ncbi:hypothetical protein R1sor_009614 [Riccia sorocarpa]|uniref:Uncharacterized protein n=1 Tax=Riccia sorocarpa TaxID=122646 RepID=A0ABD3HVK7_9MARC